MIRKYLLWYIVSIFFSLDANAQSLSNAMDIAGHGMRAQSHRLQIVAQNIANAESTGISPGSDPYRRKTIFFKQIKDPKTGTELLRIKRIGTDPKPFELRYDPSHPAADSAGYVKLPNINTMIETQDAKEAQRSYEANLTVLDVSKDMVTRTIDILR